MATLGQKGQIECISTPPNYQNHRGNWRSYGCWQQLGFFFMSRSDAETYLQEIAKVDTNGTETVGLAIHCISLDSAYNITREHHPGIDFRIVPDLQEVKDFLTTHINSDCTK